MKCRQRVHRPLGETPPLSDGAPRDNNDVGRPSCSYPSEGNTKITTVIIASPGSKSTACGYSKRWNLGDPYRVSRMQKYEIKGDKPQDKYNFL